MLKVILYTLPTIVLFHFSIFSYSQVKKGNTYEFKAVYDSVYGIKMYEPLNLNKGGDSVRNDPKGYAMQGWVVDYYPNEEKLHKGYYIDGQLKAYKNYYPGGQLEREFKMINLSTSGLNIYYPDGKPRSLITYFSKNVIKEEDYFKTGQLEYIEEYDKHATYYIQRKFFNLQGQPTSTLELTDKRKMIYDSKEYYDNGKIKESGQMIYNEAVGDYQKNGKWKYYSESGTVTDEKNYSQGEEMK